MNKTGDYSSDRGFYQGNLNIEPQGPKSTSDKLKELDTNSKGAIKVIKQGDKKVYEFTDRKLRENLNNSLKDLEIDAKLTTINDRYFITLNKNDVDKINDLTKSTITIKKEDNFKNIIEDYKGSNKPNKFDTFRARYMDILAEQTPIPERKTSDLENPKDTYSRHFKLINDLLVNTKTVDDFQKAVREAGKNKQIPDDVAMKAEVLAYKLWAEINESPKKV
jgi:hypothetical protein